MNADSEARIFRSVASPADLGGEAVTLPVPHPLWREHVARHRLRVELLSSESRHYAVVRGLRADAYGLSYSVTKEPIDDYSFHYLAFIDDRPAGAITTTMARHGMMDCEEYFPQCFLDRYLFMIGTGSRFCVVRKVSLEAKVGKLLVETGLRHLIFNGIRSSVVDVHERAVRYYERLGYRLVPESLFEHPLLGTPSHVMHFTPPYGPLKHIWEGLHGFIPEGEIETLFNQGTGSLCEKSQSLQESEGRSEQ